LKIRDLVDRDRLGEQVQCLQRLDRRLPAGACLDSGRRAGKLLGHRHHAAIDEARRQPGEEVGEVGGGVRRPLLHHVVAFLHGVDDLLGDRALGRIGPGRVVDDQVQL